MTALFHIVLFGIGIMALLFWRLRPRLSLRRIVCEVGIVALAVIVFTLLMPRPDYPVGRDVLHTLCNGRFQIYQTEDVVYTVVDAAKESGDGVCVSNVVKWSEGDDACYFVTLDRKYIVVGKWDGMIEVCADYDSIPKKRQDQFRKMRFWGPYGQGVEDFLQTHWTGKMIFCILIMFVLRVFYLFGFSSGGGWRVLTLGTH